MDINAFVQNFSQLLEETDMNDISAQTVFQDLDEWSSLLVLSTIAMLDEEYKVKIKGDELRNLNTIEDLFQVVVLKMKG